ncbi:MAG: thioredoxin domain-containing protein [Thermoanaerobaculia bacterium]
MKPIGSSVPRVLLLTLAVAWPFVADAQGTPAPAAGSPVHDSAEGTARSVASATNIAKPLDSAGLKTYLRDLFSYGDGDVSVEEDVALPVPGYRLVKVKKTFTDPAGYVESQAVYLDDAGTLALAGMLFVDSERAPQPVNADLDLASTRTLLRDKVFGHVGQSLSLDPARDVAGWKALSIKIETGYGPYTLPAYLSAADGRLLLVGRRWERALSLVEQRRRMIDLSTTPFDGAKNPSVTVVEYSDMQCPSCKKRTADWSSLVDRLKTLPIRRYVKSYPLVQVHQWAFRAASAGRCLSQRDPELFFRWKGNVYNRQETLGVEAVDAFAFDFAEANGVKVEDFSACYLQPVSSARILADLGEGYQVGVRSTPTYVVDGVLVAWFTDDLMEEFLRKTYLKGAGLPLAKKALVTVNAPVGPASVKSVPAPSASASH